MAGDETTHRANKSKGRSKRKNPKAPVDDDDRPSGKRAKKTKSKQAKRRKSSIEQQSSKESIHWDDEFQDVVHAMLSDDSTWEMLGTLLSGWEVGKVRSLVSDWRGEALGVVLGSWGAKALAGVLSGRPASVLLKCCECWKPKKIGRFLARCSKKRARKVMSGLYFATTDPYLSHKEATVMLSEWKSNFQKGTASSSSDSSKAFRSLCRDWDAEWVEAVLSGDGVEQIARRVRGGGDDGGSESDSSYESSFIDDGEDESEPSQSVSSDEESE